MIAKLHLPLIALGMLTIASNAAATQCEMDETALLSVAPVPVAAPLSAEDFSRHYGPRDTTPASYCASNDSYLFGTGLGDVTGPPYGLGMAGYAQATQTTEGVLDRQFARAFMIAAGCKPEDKVVLVSVDQGLMFHGVRQEVIDRLAKHAITADLSYQNVVIAASHSHATAAGQAHHDLYNMTTLGHDPAAFERLVGGIVTAITNAAAQFANATPGTLSLAESELLNATIQRSRPAYENNPEAERSDWKDAQGRNVTINRLSTTLFLQQGEDVKALVNWFGIHGTSLSSLNKQLSSDNKGVAAWLLERARNDDPLYYTKDAPFLAGFFQADEGDNSPNIHIDQLTDDEHRDLEGEKFTKRGGGKDDAQSMYMAGLKQAHHIQQQQAASRHQVRGPVRAVHGFIDMRNINVGNDARTCHPAYGFSAAAGAEDGRAPLQEGMRCSEGYPWLTRGVKTGLWAMLTFMPDAQLPDGFTKAIGCTRANPDYACHGEKPIIAPLGLPVFDDSQSLAAPIVPMQIIAIGDFAVIALPFEVTTMSARRIRAAVLDVLQDSGISRAVVAGLSNGYSHYLTTHEEYQMQHYEGGSTVFGPHQLRAVIAETKQLAQDLVAARAASSPHAAPDYRTHVTRLVREVETEQLADGHEPGTLITGPGNDYRVGDVARATFAAIAIQDANLPDNFMRVELQQADGSWNVIAADHDPSTKLILSGGSKATATVEWTIPHGTKAGTYRLAYQGFDHEGATEGFTVTGCD